MAQPALAPIIQQRYYSLDVFRGATVALMILVNNPGSWGHIYPPLAHAAWHGATPTDLVFPFFLFAVGNAMAFVMPKLKAGTSTNFLKKVFKRAILIFLIGLFLNWSPFVQWKGDLLIFKVWENVRILGVLQRIAICYFFAAIIVYYFNLRQAVFISAKILFAYWALVYFLGTAGNPYGLSGYFGTDVDKAVLGVTHMYKGEGVPFDPEGLASAMTAIVQVIIGFLVGSLIIKQGKTREMLSNLLLLGVTLTFAGYCWDLFFPINKKIWTSSYVLYTSGLAISVISIVIYLLEFKNKKGVLTRFFDVFGKNPLFIFFLSGFLPRILALLRWTDHYDETNKPVYTSLLPWLYLHIFKPMFTDERAGSFLYAVFILSFYWLIAFLLNKQKIYIKV